MICTFKFSFDEDVLAFLFGLATVLATFSKFGQIFPNLLVILFVLSPLATSLVFFYVLLLLEHD